MTGTGGIVSYSYSTSVMVICNFIIRVVYSYLCHASTSTKAYRLLPGKITVRPGTVLYWDTVMRPLLYLRIGDKTAVANARANGGTQ